MNRLLILLGLLVFSPAFMAQSCNKSCKDTACTEVFSMVTVQVVGLDNQPVTLDEAYTVRKKTGEKIKLEQNMEEGRYSVLDDSYRSKLENSKDQFQFVGVRDGKVVADESFDISADCCHVQKLSGKETIIVQ